MNFYDALNLLRDGKKVRAQELGDQCFYMDNNQLYLKWKHFDARECGGPLNDYLTYEWEECIE